MPRLDASRVAAWRELQSVAAELERLIDEDVTAEWDVPLGWFDVLAGLQRMGGRARPSDLAVELRLVRSSLSRRLDRLEEEGWVARHHPGRVDDHRAVVVVLTAPRPDVVAGDEPHLPAGGAGARVVAAHRRRRERRRADLAAILGRPDRPRPADSTHDRSRVPRHAGRWSAPLAGAALARIRRSRA